MAKAIYKVTLPFYFLAASRIRGGVTIPRDGGYEGTLSDEALEEIKADDTLTIETISEASVAAPTKAQLLEAATAEGLELAVTASNTVAQINEAIEVARAAKVVEDDQSEAEVVDGIRYFVDGDKVAAVQDETFINLQESPAGFGTTREEAQADLQSKIV